MRSIIKAGLALVAAAVAFSVQAQELTGTLKKVKETGQITLVHRESSIPFSYLDDKQQPIGYAMDLCMKVVDAVKASSRCPTSRSTCSRSRPATGSAAAGRQHRHGMRPTTNSVERQKCSVRPDLFRDQRGRQEDLRDQEPRRSERKTISTTSERPPCRCSSNTKKTKSADIKEI
jgi:glutamate/aspartate transport system substrate-binding protein